MIGHRRPWRIPTLGGGRSEPLDATTRVLSFVAAGVPLVTPMNGVERIVEELDIIILPFACHGLVGLVPHDTDLIPLYDLDTFATQHRAHLKRADFSLAMVMPTPNGRIAIRLDRLLGLMPMGDPLKGGDSALAELPEKLRQCIGGATQVEGLVAFFFAPDLFAELVMQQVY